MEGWIKLHRKIVDNPYYFSEPFTRSQAWVDLLILANHKDNFFYMRGIKVEVKRGQIGMSLENLAKRFKWSRGKINRFILELETTNQIVRQNSNVTTLLSIVNYNTYQQDSNADSKASSKPNSKADGHQTVKQTDTNNNVKNVNNEKELKKENGEIKISPEIDSVNDEYTEKEKTAFTEFKPVDDKPEVQKIEFAEVMQWPTFDDFWNLYDKKSDRIKCEKKFNALPQIEKEKIMQNLPDYIVATPDKAFRKDPSTYLNNKSWNNEIITKQQPNNAKSRNQQGATEAAEFLRNFHPKATG